MLLYVLVALIAAIVLPIMNRFVNNYVSARRVGLPITIRLMAPMSPLALLFGKPLRRFFMRFPWPFNDWSRISFYGWTYHDRQDSIHEKLGPAFISVSPYRNDTYIADPAAISYCYTKRLLFTRIPNGANPRNRRTNAFR